MEAYTQSLEAEARHQVQLKKAKEKSDYYAKQAVQTLELLTEVQNTNRELRSRVWYWRFLTIGAFVAGLLVAQLAHAQAPLCPYGECPKVTPLSCFESLTRPECVDTHIDWGNDLQDWAWISDQYPKQIQVAGNYYHSSFDYGEQQWHRANKAERLVRALRIKNKKLRLENERLK